MQQCTYFVTHHIPAVGVKVHKMLHFHISLQSAYHDGRETTRMQLLAGCPALQSINPRVVDQLLEVWNLVCRRIFSHYRLAARGYFTFLKLAGGVSSY